MSIFTKAFAKAAGERAIKTVAQTGASLIVAAGVGLLDADWVAIGSVAGMAGVVSLLTSVGSGLSDGSPSLGGEVLPGETPLD
jgi:hypothetical protein